MPIEDREIPRAEWGEFLDGFSREHEGWLAHVDVDGDSGAGIEVRDLPLAGIVAESTADGEETLAILLGDLGDHVAHMVYAPSRIALQTNETGAHEALEIESANERLLLRFRVPAVPEALDGLPPQHP
jgi:hypothetical protein